MRSRFPLLTLREFHLGAQSGKSGISHFSVGLVIELVLESSRVEPRNWREQNFQVSEGGTAVELNALETRDADGLLLPRASSC
jgi:hypothetical protein